MLVLQEPVGLRGAGYAGHDVFVVHYAEAISNKFIEHLGRDNQGQDQDQGQGQDQDQDQGKEEELMHE